MTTKYSAALALVLALMISPSFALAYIGPGLGAGAIAAVLGVLGAIFLALFAVVWYPIKRLLRGRRAKASASATEEGTTRE